MKNLPTVWQSTRERAAAEAADRAARGALRHTWRGLSASLVAAMRERWPDTLPSPGTPHEDILVRMGQVSVWRYLEAVLKEIQDE